MSNLSLEQFQRVFTSVGDSLNINTQVDNKKQSSSSSVGRQYVNIETQDGKQVLTTSTSNKNKISMAKVREIFEKFIGSSEFDLIPLDNQNKTIQSYQKMVKALENRINNTWHKGILSFGDNRELKKARLVLENIDAKTTKFGRVGLLLREIEKTDHANFSSSTSGQIQDSNSLKEKLLGNEPHPESEKPIGLPKKEEKLIDQDLVVIKRIRKELADKLISSPDLEFEYSDSLLGEGDAKKMEALKNKLPQLTERYKQIQSPKIRELMFLLEHPISKEDLTGHHFEERAVHSFATHLLSRAPSQIVARPLIDRTWNIGADLGRGSFKRVVNVQSAVSSNLAALACSQFNSRQQITSGKKEAQLSLQLSGKRGWPIIHAVTYQPIVSNGAVTAVRQGIQMERYDGDGMALLKLLSQKPKKGEPNYNTFANRQAMIKDLFSALSHLHKEHGLMHGDIKLENILFKKNPVTKTLTVVLADVGLARKIGSNGMGHTPLYAAPEYLEKFHSGQSLETVNQTSSDVYSLGMTLYLLHKGIPPDLVDRQSVENHILQLRVNNFDSLSIRNHMDILIRGMLEPEVEDRSSLEEVSQIFQTICAGSKAESMLMSKV